MTIKMCPCVCGGQKQHTSHQCLACTRKARSEQKIARLGRCGCGALLTNTIKKSKTGLCLKCWHASPAQKIKWTAMLGANLDYTKDPCHRCGHYPLAYHNKSGYCRKCSRHHVKLYPDKRRLRPVAAPPVGREVTPQEGVA